MMDAERVQRLRDDAAGGGAHDAEDLDVRANQFAEAVEVRRDDGGCVVDRLLGQVRDRELDLGQSRGAVVEDDVAHGRGTPEIGQDRAVHERAELSRARSKGWAAAPLASSSGTIG